MKSNEIKYLLIGIVFAFAIFLSIGAVGEKSDVGRYQLAANATPDECFVIDTKTGALTVIDLRQENVIKSSYVDGKTVQDTLNQ